MEITDYLDGKIARERNMVTNVGKLLDPFADSFSRLTIFLCFAVYPVAHKPFVFLGVTNVNLIPVWMVIILLARDICNGLLRSLAALHNTIISARKSGKIKAVFQALGVFTILMLVILSEFYNIPVVAISYFVMLVVTIVTAWSGVDYLLSNKEVLQTNK